MTIGKLLGNLSINTKISIRAIKKNEKNQRYILFGV